MSDGQVVIDLDINTKNFDEEIAQTEKKLRDMERQYNRAIQQSGKYKPNQEALAELRLEMEKTSNRLVELKRRQLDASKGGIFEGMSKSMGDILKKVAKWSLAVIGVRSVYLGIRKAMTTLTQYDDQLASKLDYMQYAIANALKPVIEWIVSALYEILTIIGKVIYAVSGYNIFQNSGIADYEKAMKRSAGSAKEIKKSLAGFDEMNVLSDNSKSGGGGGGYQGPDLSNMVGQESKLVKLTQNLVDKWWKLGQEMKTSLANPQLFNQAYGYWGTFVYGITEMFYGLWEVIEGGIEVVGSVMDIIVGIFTGNFDLIKEGLGTLLGAIGNILEGLLNIVKGIVTSIWGVVKGLLGEVWSGIKGLFGMLGEVLTIAWENMVNGAKWAWEGIQSVFSGLATFFKDIFTNAWEGVKAVFSTGGRIFTGITEGITKAFKVIANAIIDGLNKVVKVPFDGINWALQKIKDVDLWGWKPFDFIQLIKVPQIPRLAKGTIASVPGRGIPTPNGIFAEAGREAYLPLSDTQLLEELGSTLGKYITVNLTNVTELDGRTIARKVTEVNGSTDFLMNR